MSNYEIDRVERILDLIAQEQTAEAESLLQKAEAGQKEHEAEELASCRKLLNGVIHMRVNQFESGVHAALAALANLDQHYRRMERHYHDRLTAVARTTDIFARLEHAQLAKRASNARHASEISQTETQRDTLTGSLNRSGLTISAATLFVPEQQLAVVMADIDHFKAINDKHGLEAGDKVLQAIVKIFIRSLRDADLVARFGDDEFLLVVKGVGKEAAWGTCERLRQAVEKHGWGTIAPDLHVTISLGLAARMQAEDLDTLTAKAEAVLHEAKAAGRNRVATGQ
jgi:diguanylate cyclase (GGDEF)-like protein